jgi:DNA-binding SARP family transcriptional activator
LQLLGVPQAFVAGGPARLLSPPDAALFALLALRGSLGKAWLARRLWPQSEQAKASTALRQKLFKWRDRAEAPLWAGDATLLSLADGIVEHDLHDPLAILRKDATALAAPLLQGVALAGLAELQAELEVERERWRHSVLRALSALAVEHAQAGRLDAALRCAGRLVDDDPLHEHHARQLMLLHHRRHDRASALAVFERCKQALHDALGEAPDDETVALAVAIGRGDVPGAPPPRRMPLTLQHPRLLGRESLLREAAARLATGRVLLLTGSAGIGKTRVFDALLERLGMAAVCRVDPADLGADLALPQRLAAALLAALPMWPQAASRDWLAWLAAGRQGESPVGPVHPQRLARLFSQALGEARAQGVATVAIDDLQFADTPSLDWLLPLLGLADGPAWLLTSRDTPLPEPLARWLQRAHDTGALDPQLDVPALDPAALQQWLHTLRAEGVPLDPDAWSPRLHAHCGGHPLSLLQVLRALHEDGALAAPAPPARLPVPQTLFGRVARVLERGDPKVQQLAFVAALAGPDFDVELACRLLQATAMDLLPGWHRLEALGVLRGGGFSHELVRQAVADAVPSALRPALHGEIATALAGRGGGTVAARRAAHWESARRWSDAASDSEIAAQEALATGLAPSARARWLHAAELHDRAGDGARAFEARWQALRHTRGLIGYQEAIVQADALLAQATTPAQRAAAHCVRAQALIERQDPALAAAAQAAVQAAAEPGAEAWRDVAALRLADAERLAGNWPSAARRLQALAAPGAQLSAQDRAEADELRAIVLASLGRRREAAAELQRQLDAFVARRDWLNAGTVGSSLMVQLANLCRIDDATGLAERVRAWSPDAGYDPQLMRMDDMNLAAMYTDQGRYGAALKLLLGVAEAWQDGSGPPGWLVNVGNQIGSLYQLLGRHDLAARQLGEPPPDAPTWARAMRRAAQARLAAARGAPALPGLQEAWAMFQAGGVVVSPDIEQRLALERARFDAPAPAHACAVAARRWAMEHEHFALARLASLVLIEAALGLDRADEAAAAATALDAEAAPGWKLYNLYPPELWWAMVRAWRAGGQALRAQALQAHARRWIEATAQDQVDPVFRTSFLERNPFNRAFLAPASGPPPPPITPA